MEEKRPYEMEMDKKEEKEDEEEGIEKKG